MAVRHSIGRTEAKKKPSSSSMNPSLKPNSIRRTPPSSPLQPQLDPISSPLNNRVKPQYYTQKPLVSSDPIHAHAHSLTKSLSLSSSTDPSFLLKPKPQQQQKQSQISLVMKKFNPKKEKSKPKKDGREEKPVMEEFEELEKKRPAVMEVVVEEEEIDQRRLSNVSLMSVGGGRRKSFCDSKIELKEFFAMASARIVAVDMLPFMQIHAVSFVRKTHDSLEKPSPKILACSLKKEFDGVYGPAWHCIVGTSFGSFVTHSVGGFLYFSIDHKLYFLLFKTTVQKAD
ncbi:hypothetical protein ACHQM5_005979 [Ranunculus cassubicifolius]